MKQILIFLALIFSIQSFAHGDHHTYFHFQTSSSAIELRLSVPFHLLKSVDFPDSCDVNDLPAICVDKVLNADLILRIEHMRNLRPEMIEAQLEEDRLEILYYLPLPRNSIHGLSIQTKFMTGIEGGGHRYVTWAWPDESSTYLMPDDGSILEIEF